jgi:hypothetical protein
LRIVSTTHIFGAVVISGGWSDGQALPFVGGELKSD